MNIAHVLMQAIDSDEVDHEKEGQRLADWFESLPPCCRKRVNLAFTYVGGWTLETLIEHANKLKKRN